MIIEFLCNLIMTPLIFIINKLPVIDWVIPDGVNKGFETILRYVGYFMPMKHVLIIMGLSVALEIFHIAVAIFQHFRCLFNSN